MCIEDIYLNIDKFNSKSLLEYYKYIIVLWNFIFRSMDPKDKGYLLEEDLRKLLKGKSGILAEDVEEMITEYKV